MKKYSSKVIISAIILIVLVACAYILFKDSPEKLEEPAQNKLVYGCDVEELEKITVSNTYGDYSLEISENEISLADIPNKLINMDYVNMLIDECNNVEFETLVSQGKSNLDIYGLDSPQAEINLDYKCKNIKLFIGDEEKISGGRYLMSDVDDNIYLIRKSRTIRFLMPVTKYIDYIVTQPNETNNMLECLGDTKITYAGKEAIVIKRVDNTNQESIYEAMPFGAVSHIITSPHKHEVNQTELIRIADSLFGIISKNVEKYNVTQEDLTAFGFDTPYLIYEYDYSIKGDGNFEHFILKVSYMNDNYYATINDNGVIYQIHDIDCLHTSYDDLVFRFLLSPLIIDIKEVSISIKGEEYKFELSKNENKDITVMYGDKEIDEEKFRKVYTQLVSVSKQEKAEENPQLSDNPDLIITYNYIDDNKPKDEIILDKVSARRANIWINSECEYTSQYSYVEDIVTAIDDVFK